MPWPKGMSRKGYVRKDGLPHAGRTIKSAHAEPTEGSVVREHRAVTIKPVIQTEDDTEPRYHGYVGSRPVTETCPRCYFVYADGGYCTECGWSAAVVIDTYGTHSGSKWS